MPRITFITFAGVPDEVAVEDGLSAMEAAVNNSVPGIDGDCGGVVACGTCHVFVDEAWLARTGPAEDGMEAGMLDMADGANARSRLSCQIRMSAALDGLILHLPRKQH